MIERIIQGTKIKITDAQTIKGVEEKIIVYLFGEDDYETIRKVIEGEEIDG